MDDPTYRKKISLVAVAMLGSLVFAAGPAMAQKKPNIVMLMTDDTGWGDFGYMSGGGKALGHPTPNIDRIAAEGAVFTNWYGQASCTAGRASFMTGRIPIRTALSIVVAPGDPNALKKETPTIAEFFQKNGYTTYFSGKWHLGDKPDAYPIEHGFDEMKHFGAYYPGVYTYNDTSPQFHPWFPSYNAEFNQMYNSVVNLGEWEGEAGKPARRTGTINWDYLATFDIRQADSAIDYIKSHAKSDKPFFMSVNFMKMHNPNNPAPQFRGRTKLGNYSDSMLELDYNIGRIMDAIRAEAPDTIVIVTADNGAWQDAYPDAGTVPFRGMKGTGFEGGFRVPGLMWWPGKIPAGAKYDEMMSHIDLLGHPRHHGRHQGAAHRRDDGQQRQADLLRQHRQQRVHPRQGGALRPRHLDLHRRRDLPGCPRRPRWRPQGAMAQDRVEVCLYGQGLLARRHGRPRRHRRDIQPHDGPL